MALTFRIAAAVAAWAGLVGFGHFLLALAGIDYRFAALALDALSAGAVVFLARRWDLAPEAPPGRFRFDWVLAVALALGALLVAAPVWGGLAALPHGDWDAWAIWNLRARMIDGGQWGHAVSPDLTFSHPDYPLLLPSLVANLWRVAGGQATMAPILLAFTFLLVTGASLISSVSLLRGRANGLLAGLVLLASVGFLAQGVSQYADMPLSMFFVLTLACLALKEAPMAGFFASCAAWTKNEGIAYALIALAAGTWLFYRSSDRRLKRFWLGAAPGLAIVAVFKLAIAPSSGVETSFAFVASPSRYGEVLLAFGRELIAMGLTWKHPVLLLAVLAFVLRGRRSRMGTMLVLVVVAQLAVYFGVYILTSQNLQFLLSTSLNRLLAQIWPILLLAVFYHLNSLNDDAPPPEAVPVPVGAPKTPPRRRRKAPPSSP